MKAWFHNARRMAVAGTVALVVGVPGIACMGGETTPTDQTAPAPTPDPEPADPATKIVGTWRMIPDEAKLRELKIIDAAISGKPQKKEKLGDLTKEEQKLFDDWEDKKGPEVKAKKAEIRFMKGCQFVYTDSQVTVKFDEEAFGPVSYTVVSATDANLTLRFDPGLGNGVETHSIDWESDTRGLDHIKSEDGTDFTPFAINKR